MPRSKRKAKAASDFARKKTKLGKKARPSNLTDTSITNRQIHVPNQTRTTTTTTGLPLRELLSRTRHHNANARTSSLNALSNALTDASATAHTALVTPSPLVAAACQALSDDSPPVRAAAAQLLRRLLAVVDCTPFRSTITNLLLAALTHISLDIRVHVAATLPHLPRSLLSQSPLEALSDLLTTAHPRARTAALAAIASLCAPLQHHEPEPSRRFCYHRPIPRQPDDDFLAALPAPARAQLVVRVAEAVQEHLHQHPRSIATSCAALLRVLSCGIPGPATSAVGRVLKAWRYQPDTHPLAGVALSAGEAELAAGYVVKMLQRDKYNDALDTVVRQCIHDSQVALAFGERFRRAVGERDTGFVRKAGGAAVMVMQGRDAGLIRAVPEAVMMLDEGDGEIAEVLVKAACRAWKGGTRDSALAEELVGVCTSPLVTSVVGEVVGVAACADVLTGDACVAVLGESVRLGRVEVVDTFVDVLEWLASRDCGERLRAIALSRVLGRVVRGEFSECPSREAAVV